MKDSILKISSYFLAMAVVVMISCSGDDGEAGPQGPQGEDGVIYGNFTEDFSGEEIVSPFSTSGDAPWSVANYTIVVDEEFETRGSLMAINGAVGDGLSTSMDLDVDMPEDGVLSFESIISSEAGYDYLIWSLDGVEINGISGDGGPFTFNIPLSAGEHTVTWTYLKDGICCSEGNDVGTVDNVIITNYAEAGRLKESVLPSSVLTLAQRGAEKKN